MKILLKILLCAMVCWVPGINPARGQGIIIEHSGANDPATEGFTSQGSAQVEGITNDMGYNAWVTPWVLDPSGSNFETMSYSASINDIANVDWMLTVTLRIPTTNEANVFFVDIDTGSLLFDLLFGTVPNGSQRVYVPGYTSIFQSGGSIYDTYQIIYSAETQTASLWINGMEELSGINGQNDVVSAYLSWGGGGPSQAGPAQANWNLVSLEVVPEPSAWSLIALGGGIFIYVRRQFQTKRRL
jgi:hypothetical protein